MTTDGVKEKYRAMIIDILAANDRVDKAVLFGSRATETFTVTSDVDIALFGDRLTLTDQADLAAAIEELTIPQRVDLLLHNTISNNALREHIRKHGVEWYRRREEIESPLRAKYGPGNTERQANHVRGEVKESS